MASFKEKIKTPKGLLRYVTVTGEGRDTSMPGEPASMSFVASVALKADSPELAEFKAHLEDIWKAYKLVEPQAKGTLTYGRLSKCSGVRAITEEVADKNDIDPETDKVRKVETDEVLITFKTSTMWPDGKVKSVAKYANKKDAEGKVYAADVTDFINAADWTIANDSTGIVHGLALGNTTGGKAKLTLTLTAVQIAKLIKYTGDQADIEMDEDEEVTDMGEDDMPENDNPASDVEV